MHLYNFNHIVDGVEDVVRQLKYDLFEECQSAHTYMGVGTLTESYIDSLYADNMWSPIQYELEMITGIDPESPYYHENNTEYRENVKVILEEFKVNIAKKLVNYKWEGEDGKLHKHKSFEDAYNSLSLNDEHIFEKEKLFKSFKDNAFREKEKKMKEFELWKEKQRIESETFGKRVREDEKFFDNEERLKRKKDYQ